MPIQAHLAITHYPSPYPHDDWRRDAPPEPCIDMAHSYHAEKCDPDKCAAACDDPWCGWEHRQQKIDKRKALLPAMEGT